MLQFLQDFFKQFQKKEYIIPAVLVILLLSWWCMSYGPGQAGGASGKKNFKPIDVAPRQINHGRQMGGGSDKKLVLYYAPWCGHCKSLKPTWEQLAEKYHGKQVGEYNIKVIKVNADEDPEATREQNIDGFPTVILFKDGDKVQYDGDRSLDSLEKFLITN